jgi:hypothetical protein
MVRPGKVSQMTTVKDMFFRRNVAIYFKLTKIIDIAMRKET